jgi:hypothetical protein
MNFSRRELVLGLAGIAMAGRAATSAQVLERRVYGYGSVLPPEEALHRNGIRRAWVRFALQGTEYGFTFDSLASRAQAWDRFNADREWCVLREAGSVRLTEITLYPGGKIFEMSL